MAIQDAYTDRMPAGLPGHIADMRGDTLISGTAEADIGFGLPVVQGTADGAIRLATTGDTRIKGITVRDRYVTGNDFKANEEARVMTRGPIFVEVVADVEADEAVYVILADGTFTNVSTGNLAVEGARFEKSVASGGLSIIAID